MAKQKMRVVSMVPSWTETLLEAGVDVVGRTRYCIHPASAVAQISIIGGTKDISWPKLISLNADLLLLDEEENPRSFAEQSPIPWLSTHVTSVADLPAALQLMASGIQAPALEGLSHDWRQLLDRKSGSNPVPFAVATDWPGLLQWIVQPDPGQSFDHLLYLIWRKPWMAVSRDTFIGSVFSLLGYSLPIFTSRYPKIQLEDYPPDKTLLLFSSEPYPFARHLPVLKELGYKSALVDGESFSWFGVRSLRFLQSQLSATRITAR